MENDEQWLCIAPDITNLAHILVSNAVIYYEKGNYSSIVFIELCHSYLLANRILEYLNIKIKAGILKNSDVTVKAESVNIKPFFQFFPIRFTITVVPKMQELK